MIAFIKGTIVSVEADSIVIDHDGMGWELYYPHVEKVHSGERYRFIRICRFWKMTCICMDLNPCRKNLFF